MSVRGAVLVALVASCGAPTAAPATHEPLPRGAVARVGTTTIDGAAVARVAEAQGIDARSAREALVRDALLAEGAGARGLADSYAVRLMWESELARRTLRKLLADARATPPTEEELAIASARRWLDVDRPAGVRTAHAVALFKPTDAEDKKAKGRTIAAAIAKAVGPAVARALALPFEEDAPAPNARIGPQSDPDPLSSAFRQAALAVPTEGMEVRVEPLPPVAADGRMLVPGDEHLDAVYVNAAVALPVRGALSQVVETGFGAHVILLLERTPPMMLAGAARAAKLTDDVVYERARAMSKRLLADRKARSKVEPDAVGLLALVRLDE